MQIGVAGCSLVQISALWCRLVQFGLTSVADRMS